MSSAQQNSVEAWLEDKNCLISLPEICFKIRALLNDPMHSRSDVAALIRHDPVLTAKLLKLVNSAYYSLPAPISNISDSIGLIGDQYLNDLVVTATIIEAFNGVAYKISNFDLKQFWTSSMFCAVLARNLASVCSDDLKEDMFIAGLLLKIGKLPMYYHMPQLLADLRAQQDQEDFDDIQIEQAALGFNHVDIGVTLAKSWNFSELLIDSIASHKTQPGPDLPLSRQIPFLANKLKSRLNELANMNPESDESMEEFDPEIVALLAPMGLSENLLTSVLESSYRDFSDIYETFCSS